MRNKETLELLGHPGESGMLQPPNPGDPSKQNPCSGRPKQPAARHSQRGVPQDASTGGPGCVPSRSCPHLSAPRPRRFQLYKCPDVGCTAPAPRFAPGCQFPEMLIPGERGVAGALAPALAAAANRDPPVPEHHRGKRSGGRGKKGWERGNNPPPKLSFLFTCRHELHCEPRPGSDLIGIGVGRGSFQKFMFILGDFSGFIYRSGSQPVL
ncbi:uncharacterized protein ACIB01_015014 [Guaruba guarouba]